MQTEETGKEGQVTCNKCGKQGNHIFNGVYVCEGLKENETVESYGEAKANRDIQGNDGRRAMRGEKY